MLLTLGTPSGFTRRTVISQSRESLQVRRLRRSPDALLSGSAPPVSPCSSAVLTSARSQVEELSREPPLPKPPDAIDPVRSQASSYLSVNTFDSTRSLTTENPLNLPLLKPPDPLSPVLWELSQPPKPPDPPPDFMPPPLISAVSSSTIVSFVRRIWALRSGITTPPLSLVAFNPSSVLPDVCRSFSRRNFMFRLSTTSQSSSKAHHESSFETQQAQKRLLPSLERREEAGENPTEAAGKSETRRERGNLSRISGLHSKRNRTIGLGELDQLVVDAAVTESIIRWASCTHIPTAPSLRLSLVC